MLLNVAVCYMGFQFSNLGKDVDRNESQKELKARISIELFS